MVWIGFSCMAFFTKYEMQNIVYYKNNLYNILKLIYVLRLLLRHKIKKNFAKYIWL